jgi:CRISPR-associated protein Cmr2
MNYLFSLHIGPTQSSLQFFISSARRTHDLWFGSNLFSELAKTAATTILRRNSSNRVIFPARVVLEDDAERRQLQVANKILAIVEEPSDPQQLGNEIDQAIGQRLRAIANQVFEKIEDPAFSDDKGYQVIAAGRPVDISCRAAAERQIDDFIQCFWAALPFDPARYFETRRELERLMAARKNSYDFQRPVWSSNRPKSSIDGQLESVIPEERYPQRKDRDKGAVNLQKIHYLYRQYGAAPAERLSGIDLLKRRGSLAASDEQTQRAERERFPSTSHIATVPYLQRLETLSEAQREEARKAWNRYIEKVKPIELADPSLMETVWGYWRTKGHDILGYCDGGMLFPERLTDAAADKESFARKHREAIIDAQKALKAFYDSVKEAPGERLEPGPYYAILQADGDYMGRLIDRLSHEEGGFELHSALSETLSNFASSVHKTIRDCQGALIYAGGDDVLALVPLHQVIACGRRLSQDFYQRLEGFLNNARLKGAQEGDTVPTLSVGIAIVHHLELLQDALETARAAEKKAKGVSGKNALAITVQKRGGEDYTVRGKWEDLDTFLVRLIEYFRDGIIPKGTAYELRTMAQRLTPPASLANQKQRDELEKVKRVDAGRILRRKLFVPENKGAWEESEARKREILAVLKARIAGEEEATGVEPSPADHSRSKSVELEEFINELLVAQMLAEAMDLAGMPKGAQS